MASPRSFSNLHLQARLWIAQLNWDINVIRIYGDYLQGLAADKDHPELKLEVKRRDEQFTQIRKDIDDLRNDLHLLKMKFATFVRDKKPYDEAVLKGTSFASLKKRFSDFRKSFDKLLAEMNELEEQVAA